MKEEVFFLVEDVSSTNIEPYIERHLQRYAVTIGDQLPEQPHGFRLIVLWNLHRVIKDLPPTSNIVVFHSSDLPVGRGWAPIYHTLADGLEQHVISAIFAAPKVDCGEVIAKARFRVQPCHTAEIMREIDEEICILMAAAILEKFCGRDIVGVPQIGEPTYYSRRTPADSEVDPQKSLIEILPHLRACGASHPAFFDWQGCRYYLDIKTAGTKSIPEDLLITFPDDLHRA
jgi:methionyl-tRNA formyltransferase